MLLIHCIGVSYQFIGGLIDAVGFTRDCIGGSNQFIDVIAVCLITYNFLIELITGEIALVVLINSLARLHCQRLCPW